MSVRDGELAGGPLAWLAAIVQSSQDAIIGKSLSGKILTWNSGAERLYGWTEADAIGQDVTVLIPPDQREIERQLFARIRNGEQLQRVIVQRRRRSGRIIDVSLSMSPILDADAVIIGVASSSRDAGEERRAETSRRQILDAAPDAMVCVDEAGVITFVNARVETLFRYRAKELIGRPAEVLLAVEQRADHLGDRGRFLADLRPRPMLTDRQLYGRRSDGQTFPVDIGLSAVETADKIITIEAFRDVSERFAVETALRESEERLRQLASSLEFGFTLTQLDPPEYLYFSPGFTAIMGLDPDGPKPTLRGMLAMVHPDDQEDVTAEFWAGAKSGQSVAAEMRIVRPDGEVRWLRCTSSPVAVAAGGVQRAAATIEDITARKTAETAVRSAQQEAEKANAAKSEFLSRMSHELRTPLNAVLGFAQLLELDKLSKSQHSSVGHILQGGRHLLAMIDDVLDISRIESDQLELSIESVLVSDVLTETLGLMRPTADAAQVEIRYDALTIATGRYVAADRRRLRQIVLNLLSNGIKYNRRGGLLAVSCDMADHLNVRVRITDTGAGIRADDLPRLFIPFNRLGDNAAEIEGTGIGLALSQRLVSSMGGRLEVESEVGVGSTFAVVMPVAESPDARPVTLAGQSTKDQIRTVVASNLLYIEDNLSNVRLIERILERRPGWTMVHAGQGSLGLELAASTNPTLIFLDLHLPDLPGIDVLRALQSDLRTADIPVVVLSADANQHQISRLRSAGAQHYLTKPLDVTEVIRVLDLHGARREDGDGRPARHEAVRSTVLYVEDDEANVRLVQRIIQLRPPVELVVVGTGQDAIRAAEETLPQLILLDRRLPDMSGGDVLRQLKIIPATATIPVVMLSGDTGRDEVAEMLHLGAIEFLAKPFDLNDLLAIVDRFCCTSA